MKTISKSSFKPDQLLIDHNITDFKFYSKNKLRSKYNKDENEKKLLDFISDKEKFKIISFDQHQIFDFLSSKFKAMEKMDLNDECFEGEIEIRKVNIDKDIFPKLKRSNIKNVSNSPKKIIKFKNLFSPKKSEIQKDSNSPKKKIKFKNAFSLSPKKIENEKDVNSQKTKNKFKKIISTKKSRNKINNKNIIINANGKSSLSNIESIDFIDDINFDINNEVKENESHKFFSNKLLLHSIISEMKDK